jgi:hypothetical protein
VPVTHEVGGSDARLLGRPRDAHRYFSCCGGVADFAGLCRALPTYVVDLLWNQYVILDSGSAYRGSNPCLPAIHPEALPRDHPIPTAVFVAAVLRTG